MLGEYTPNDLNFGIRVSPMSNSGYIATAHGPCQTKTYAERVAAIPNGRAAKNGERNAVAVSSSVFGVYALLVTRKRTTIY